MVVSALRKGAGLGRTDAGDSCEDELHDFGGKWGGRVANKYAEGICRADGLIDRVHFIVRSPFSFGYPGTRHDASPRQ